ncbi:MAG TPA: zinc-finger-containing protein [Chitinophagales bacterium]|nr:zinc-finger-containing protein [Chitinophagales bacterium]
MNEELMQIINGTLCPYCQCATKLVNGEVIYPHKVQDIPRPKYLDKMYYVCILNKDHYVGTYHDNKTSLGRLADTELRRWKNLGHRTFDVLWKEKKVFHSSENAYKWLSDKMGLPGELTHFGMFTVEQCKQAIEFCNELSS